MPIMTPELYIAQLILTFLSALVTSGGFWLFLDSKKQKSVKKNPQNRLLMGLAHDRILHLGMTFIKRGWITQDEYENLHDYLYDPYKELEGNGSVNRIMCEIEKLPIRESKISTKESDCNEIAK